ncbi:MAG: ImmA/IrrE family metallo-endopeptidase [Trueperaceae bacterium]|nr:ImmA/IrrE family metallo-endopeptidase [Trueperaceae bacterium]
MTRVPIRPEMLRWACERGNCEVHDLAARFPQLPAWQRGEKQPTFKQLEAFAQATHVPFGYLFLPAPPEEPLPIADFRAHSAIRNRRPSGDLLDTIYAQQRRQDWFREHATVERLDPVPWIGTESLDAAPATVAAKLRERLDFEPDARRSASNWVEATRVLVSRLEALGVLVAINGVVENNTSRPLDPEEFRGFCLADTRAPLIFVNGADHKASQAFTLCHELAHLALGQSGLSDEDPGRFEQEGRERWCDEVASEILVPLTRVDAVRGETAILEHAARLSRDLRVSPLVTVRRVAERSAMSDASFRHCYRRVHDSLPEKAQGGGDFYAIALTRVGKRLAREVVASTLEGNTTYMEAFRLLGVRGSDTFRRLSSRLGFA